MFQSKYIQNFDTVHAGNENSKILIPFSHTTKSKTSLFDSNSIIIEDDIGFGKSHDFTYDQLNRSKSITEEVPLGIEEKFHSKLKHQNDGSSPQTIDCQNDLLLRPSRQTNSFNNAPRERKVPDIPTKRQYPFSDADLESQPDSKKLSNFFDKIQKDQNLIKIASTELHLQLTPKITSEKKFSNEFNRIISEQFSENHVSLQLIPDPISSLQSMVEKKCQTNSVEPKTDFQQDSVVLKDYNKTPIFKIPTTLARRKTSTKTTSGTSNKLKCRKSQNDAAKIFRNDSGKSLNDTGRSLNDTGKSLNDTGKSLNDTGKSLNDTGKSLNDTGKPLNLIGRSRNDTGKFRNDTEKLRNDTEESRIDTGESRNDPEKSRNDPEKSRNDPEKSRNDIGKSRNDTGKSRNNIEKVSQSGNDTGKTSHSRNDTRKTSGPKNARQTNDCEEVYVSEITFLANQRQVDSLNCLVSDAGKIETFIARKLEILENHVQYWHCEFHAIPSWSPKLETVLSNLAKHRNSKVCNYLKRRYKSERRRPLSEIREQFVEILERLGLGMKDMLNDVRYTVSDGNIKDYSMLEKIAIFWKNIEHDYVELVTEFNNMREDYPNFYDVCANMDEHFMNVREIFYVFHEGIIDLFESF